MILFLGLRPQGRIFDFEYLAEIGPILLWGGERPKKIIINVADNQSALSWIDGEGIPTGSSSRLQITFRRELIRRQIQLYGMYIRAGHNSIIDFPAHASDAEISAWAMHRVATRRSLWGIWPSFLARNDSSLDFSVSGGGEGGLENAFPPRDSETSAGRDSDTCTLRGVCLSPGLQHAWIDPFHYKIGDLARERGSHQHSGRRVDFSGTPIQPRVDLNQFKTT